MKNRHGQVTEKAGLPNLYPNSTRNLAVDQRTAFFYRRDRPIVEGELSFLALEPDLRNRMGRLRPRLRKCFTELTAS
jgi:hypothetical protein